MTQEYILKYKNFSVLIFYLDDTNYTFQDLGEIFNYDHLPYGLADKKSGLIKLWKLP